MKKELISSGLLGLCCTIGGLQSFAQLTISAQVRTRTELRDGQGAPLPKDARPAFFTSQRSRLSAGFSGYRFKTGITLQDVRVWGQDVSTINRTTTADNNALMLHEAWAEISLLDTTAKTTLLALKLGRQEWVYDDSRLLGNLDWLQQGRRHDAALVKWEKRGIVVHAGLAFNQNKEAVTGTLYNSTPPGNYAATTHGGTMYKSLQFLYAGKKWAAGNASFLLLADQFSKFNWVASNGTQAKVITPGTNARFTTGFYGVRNLQKASLTASAYYQFGKNGTGQKVSGYLLSGSAIQSFNKKVSAGVGIDYTSGGSNGSTSKAFDPLYGMPHKFWGLMDYFYVASPFGQGGLVDYYLKSKWKASEQLMLSVDLHQFNSATKIATTNKQNRKTNFGQELDLVANLNLTKQIGFEAGYAHFFATSLLAAPAVKDISNARTNANWAYVMINIKPELLFK